MSWSRCIYNLWPNHKCFKLSHVFKQTFRIFDHFLWVFLSSRTFTYQALEPRKKWTISRTVLPIFLSQSLGARSIRWIVLFGARWNGLEGMCRSSGAVEGVCWGNQRRVLKFLHRTIIEKCGKIFLQAMLDHRREGSWWCWWRIWSLFVLGCFVQFPIRKQYIKIPRWRFSRWER